MVWSAASASSSAGLAASSFSSATALSSYSTRWDTHHFHGNNNDDDDDGENGEDDNNSNDEKDTGMRLMVLSINLLVVYRESVNLIDYITRRLSADSQQLWIANENRSPIYFDQSRSFKF